MWTEVEGLGAGLVREEVLPLRNNSSLTLSGGEVWSAIGFAIPLTHQEEDDFVVGGGIIDGGDVE